jgi:hypothetical protein
VQSLLLQESTAGEYFCCFCVGVLRYGDRSTASTVFNHTIDSKKGIDRHQVDRQQQQERG